MRILVIDVGGTHVKVLATGHKKRVEIPSGPRMTPAKMVSAVRAPTVGDRLIIDKIAEVSEMSAQELIVTAKAMVAEGKGLLAMDESTPTCNKRFEKVGIPQTEEARRSYRELIVTTPGLGEFISGVILYDETIRQSRKDGTQFIKVITDAGIIPGIKVDTGAKDLAGHPGEKITEGLDGLRDRLREYFHIGALTAVLGGIDTLVFTGGIGEKAAPVRRRACEGLEHLGIRLDDGLNSVNGDPISAAGSKCVVRVIPANEDLVIARHTYALSLQE